MPYSFAAHLARFGPSARIPPMDIASARSYCAKLTRDHYENFTVASALLPRRLLPHFYPVYAYCRWADDLADETGGGQTAIDLLAWWRQELLDCFGGTVRHPVMIALRPTIERFRIPPTPFLDLLAAFEQDQHVSRYATFDELLHYCQRSANPVGRLVLYLCQSFDETRAALSDHICTGLQLANFWQDVKRDRDELGRIYIPDEDRQSFGYADEDFRAGRFTPAFQELMRFEVNRARGFLERGRPLLGMISRDVSVDIELFLEGGLAILRQIERVGYDVWKQRPEVGKRTKARLLVRALASGFGFRVSGLVESKTTISNALATTNGFPETRNPKPETRNPKPETRSFAWCHRLTRRSAKNFYWSFQVLPRRQRRAMDALYAFMRVTDDLADEPGEVTGKRDALNGWRTSLDHALAGNFTHPLHPALSDTMRRHGIPSTYVHAVIDGVAMDLEPLRFDTFAELYGYCYRVASAVGLSCIHIWGFQNDAAKEYAEAGGIAFQLTNILRDLGEDLDRGRVYIPREDIERFGCPPETWRDCGDNFQRMMRFQVERARNYYRKAELLIPLLSPTGRAVFQVMACIYRGLLEEIERRRYDVFGERVRLSRWRKLRALLMAFPVRWGWV